MISSFCILGEKWIIRVTYTAGHEQYLLLWAHGECGLDSWNVKRVFAFRWHFKICQFVNDMWEYGVWYYSLVPSWNIEEPKLHFNKDTNPISKTCGISFSAWKELLYEIYHKRNNLILFNSMCLILASYAELFVLVCSWTFLVT